MEAPQPRNRLQQQLKRMIFWVPIDAAVILAGYGIAYFGRALTTPLGYIETNFVFFALITTLVCLYIFGVYRRLWIHTSNHGASILADAVLVAGLIVLGVDLLLSPRPLPISVVLLANLLVLAGLALVRYRSRMFTGFEWRWNAIWHRQFPEAQERVLIVGAGEAGQIFAMRLKSRERRPDEEPSHYVVGFVDDDPEKQDLLVEGKPVLGTRLDIPRLVEQHDIDLIAVAIHRIAGEDFRDILRLCQVTGARIKIIPDTFALVNSTTNVPLLRDVRPGDILGRKTIGRHEDIDFTPVTGKVVMVTGAAGSIGSELVRQMLHYSPTKLIVLDNNESGLHDLLQELSSALAQQTLVPILADITDARAIETVFAEHKPHVVFHAAAYKHVPMLELHPSEAVRVNIGGTWLLAEMAHRYHAERFVLISSDKAVNPSSVMGASKRVCELVVRAVARKPDNQTLFAAVRFGNVLNSRGSVVPLFNKQIDQGGPITVTHPEMKRYFMAISEAVNLVIHAASMTTGDDLFMLRMGDEINIVDLARRMIRMRGLVPDKDIEIKFTGVRPGEKLQEVLQHDSEIAADTLHPQIVRLHDVQEHFNGETFLQEIQDLVTHCGPGCDRAVDLPAVAEGQSHLATSGSWKYCLVCLDERINSARSTEGTRVDIRTWAERRSSTL